MPQVLQVGSKNLNSENWEVFHPNGKHMFTCGERKAEWYVDRDLAVVTGDKKIQLTFEPKGYGFKEDEIFGLAGRNVMCVVSGEKEGLQRHHIVPYCYRRHFPEEYKTKNHHDVILVSYKVHEEYERHASKYKDELAIEFGVKNLNDLNLEYTRVLCDFSETKIKTVSKLYALFGSYGKIPQDIVLQNLEFVSKNSGIPFEILRTYNYVQLYKLYTILKEEYDAEFDEIKRQNRTKYDHGYHLVQKLDTHEKLEAFIKRWRLHFINTMNPPYMPEGWSVDFRCRVDL